jgi:hypothetical protein
VESVKDRWVFCLRPDADRESLLAVQDDSIRRRIPWASYREGRGGDYKRWASSLAESSPTASMAAAFSASSDPGSITAPLSR